MRAIYYYLVILLTLSSAWGAEGISIEEFKKIASPDKRMEIIDRAPPEQKEELKKITIHLELVQSWGGEAGLEAAREREVIGARGLDRLGAIFSQQTMMWQSWIVRVGEANEDAGMAKKEIVKIEKKLMAQVDLLVRRLPIIHTMLLRMAPSPRALELETEAKKLSNEMSQRESTDGITPFHPITKQERVEFDKRIETIFQEMKRLPKLTPEQVRRELDAMTDDKVRGGSGD